MYIYSNALYNTLLGTFAGLLDGAVQNLNLTSRIHRCPQNGMGVVKNLQVHEMLSETCKYMKLYKTSSSLYQKQSVKKKLMFLYNIQPESNSNLSTLNLFPWNFKLRP